MILEFSKTVEQFELTPIEARLFAYLYLKQEPVTLDQMSEDLGNSKTSMSNSVRSLEAAHLIQKVWRKGVRKHLYMANEALYKSFMQTYKNKWMDTIEHQLEALYLLKEEIPTGKAEDKLTEQLNTIIDFHEELRKTFLHITINEDN